MIWMVLTVAGLTWGLTQENLFAEFRQWLGKRYQGTTNFWLKKLLILPTCPYCAAHWLSAGLVVGTGSPLLWIVPIALMANWVMGLNGLFLGLMRSFQLDLYLKEKNVSISS